MTSPLPKQDRARAAHLRRKYGITLEQYDQLLSQQDGRCAVCTRPAEAFTTRLAVDHNHVTGEIRGLLCTHCNHRLIGRHRDAALLRRMADYVERQTGWFVPVRKTRPRKTKRK